MKMRMFLGMMLAVGMCGAQNLLENGDFTVQFKRLSSPAGWDMQCSGNCKMEVDKTVTYNGNGNTGGAVPTDSSSPYSSGDTVTVLGNTGSLEKTGKTFSGWNTKADGSGTTYTAAQTFTITASTTLYAKWTD